VGQPLRFVETRVIGQDGAVISLEELSSETAEDGEPVQGLLEARSLSLSLSLSLSFSLCFCLFCSSAVSGSPLILLN
jgi:hypothetical protein